MYKTIYVLNFCACICMCSDFLKILSSSYHEKCFSKKYFRYKLHELEDNK